MAIPFSKYIDINTNVVNDVFGLRDWSGLIFTATAMKTGAEKKTDFETNLKVVSLTRDEIESNFDDAGLIAFINRYFSYSGGTRTATHINLAYVGSSESALDAYKRVTNGTSTVDEFCNFGSFVFYDSSFTRGDAGDEGLLDVATANEENKFGWVMVVKTNSSNQSADSAAYNGFVLTHLTHDPICAIAWYASCDYNQEGSSSTIDYKQFAGAVATVKTASEKATADGLKVNYIGLVQNYGNGLAFYQNGVNMDGTDLGVVRDECWMNSEITSAYFNLQNSVQKLPANHVGAAMVRNIVVGVAERAIANGSILVDKPLDASQIAAIMSYSANNEEAVASVSSNGYYIAVNIVKQDNHYVCHYTLIYAKGDHIGSVNGVHILV